MGAGAQPDQCAGAATDSRDIGFLSKKLTVK